MTIGGVTAYLKGGAKVAQCANLGAVTGSGTMYTGGVVGQAIAGTFLSESYNAGTVTAAKGYAGGVAGYTMGCATSDCYNVGAVSLQAEKGSVGGVTGWFTGTVELTNCYNAGTVTGGQNCGALAGTAAETQIHNSHYLADTAEYAVASKKFTGSQKTADEMRAESFAALLGAAFAPDTHGINGGYPVLVWQKPAHTHTYTEAVTPPTCTEKGYTTHTCPCGDSYVDTYVDALGHRFVDGKCTVCGAKDPNHNPFKDVRENAYYYDAVQWAVKGGITAGTGKDTFSPDEGCTRAQIVTFLYRAAGSPKVENAVNPFRDVSPADGVFYDAILWAYTNGITAGTGKDTFSPNATCTRAQIVTFLYKACGNGAEAPAPSFKDVPQDAFYAKAAAWAYANGVTSGTGKDTFSPNATCTRAQAVTFLYKANQLEK